MNFTKKSLDSILEKTAKIIDPVIEELLNFYVDEKNRELINYQIFTGGKRLRPVLAIISCKLLGGEIKDVLYVAAGLEIIHNYSLIVDDIIDNSILRRGKPTCWFKFGKSFAQCVAITYSAALFQAANRSKEPLKISELFAKTVKKIIDGEILDILFEVTGREGEPYFLKNRYLKITEKDYFEMISKKTATLFQTSCQVGGILAGAKKRKIEALGNYGFNLGLAFQIRDDILDIFGKEKSFQKEIGKDIIERKKGNIVILFTLKKLSSVDKKRFLAIMKKNKITKKDVSEAMKLIRKTDSYQKAYQLGKDFIKKAKDNLNFLPKNKWNDILKKFADFTMKREK